jgi:hypothetical protein
VEPTRAANDNQINRTLGVWRPRSPRSLTEEDARQIAANMTGFFSVLAEWARAEPPLPANDTGPASSPVADDLSNDR